MRGRGGRTAVVLATALSVAGIILPPTNAGAADPCSVAETRTLTGAQSSFTATLAPNERVGATEASWIGTDSYPVRFTAGSDSCWDGGLISGTFSVGSTWNFFHGNAGFGFSGPNFTVNHPDIFNYGDGIQIRENSDGFVINDAHLAYVHDDCIENDRLLNGTVNNSFLDGCYVGMSARRTEGTTYDGHLNTWTISNSLIRLQAMPMVYSGSAAGHGGFFKWDEANAVSPKLAISDSIFRADQTTNHGSLTLPPGYPVTCSNNTMVWLGVGAFPGSLPACFTVTTDRTVWDNAVNAWSDAHPGVIAGPEVSVGDASVIEGTSGGRRLQFPLSLSTPPALGQSVTVYWATAPGTAGTADFTTTRGKVVFTGSQVLKHLLVSVKQDATDEANENMFVVVAGVVGGRNHRERGTGTIVDDDPGSGVRLAVSDVREVEGNFGDRPLGVPIALSVEAPLDVVISYSIVATGTASGADFLIRSSSVKIPAGGRFASIVVKTYADLLVEGTETFSLVVTSATNATIVDNTGTITIIDDD